MSNYPEQVEKLHDAMIRLKGVRSVAFGIRRLDGIGEREMSFPGELGDLPHVALRRTKGALEGEVLVSAEIVFEQDRAGWIALEFLAWWVRDLSRSGDNVQMRPLALPPVAYETQLGRTLKFVIEFFFLNPEEDTAPLLETIEKHATWLHESIDSYAEVLANPVYPADDDDPGSIESLRHAASQGNPEAQFTLALRYDEGEGVKPDLAEALRWFTQAAEQGHLDAQMYVGLYYAKGKGVDRDLKAAVAWYQKAAGRGHALAMGLLGQCYEDAEGVVKDLTEAAKWYRHGAEHGEACCQAQLGECYELGKGVEKDLHEALTWYHLALDQGFDHVQPAIERVEAQLEKNS